MGSEAEVGRIMGWPVQVAMIAEVWEDRGERRVGVAYRDGGLCAHCWRMWFSQAQSQQSDVECLEPW